jgi:hypothetical protein
MDLVYGPVNLFHGVFFWKIILEIPKPLYFFKNTPELFQNYILVPIILHIGPCLTFYNYS